MIFSLNETYTFLTPYSQGGLSAKSELHLMQDSGGLWWNSRQNVAAAGVGRLFVLGTEHEPETGPNIRVGADNTWRSVTTHTTDYVCTGSRHSQPARHLGQNNLQVRRRSPPASCITQQTPKPALNISREGRFSTALCKLPVSPRHGLSLTPKPCWQACSTYLLLLFLPLLLLPLLLLL